MIIQLSKGIKRLEDWRVKAPPKGKGKQWKNNYSAKEFARLWFDDGETPAMPEEIRALCEKVFLDKFDVLDAIPEHVTKLNNSKGGQRNHDMFLSCQTQSGVRFIVCIEAKVAEPLGETVGTKRAAAETKNQDSAKKIKTLSKIPERIEMMEGLLKMDGKDTDHLRYQLFTGTVGTIFEAEKRKICNCLFLVLKILTSSAQKSTNKRKRKRPSATAKAIELFLEANTGHKDSSIGTDCAFVRSLIFNKDKLKFPRQVYLGYLEVNAKPPPIHRQ